LRPETSRAATGVASWFGLTAWSLAVSGLLIYLVVYFFPLVPGCDRRPNGLFDTMPGIAIPIGTAAVILSIAWWALGADTLRRRMRRLAGATLFGLPVGVLLVLAALVIDHGCLKGAGLTYVNRTTVPIAVVDRDSRTIVPPCSERTIGWLNTWGGNHSPEPMPPGAFVVSAESYRVPADALPTITIVIAKDPALIQREPDPQNIPCEGVPRPLPSSG
jgi:hypothetical protein